MDVVWITCALPRSLKRAPHQLHYFNCTHAGRQTIRYNAPMIWDAMDCSSGEWLDLASPYSGSWKRFQAFRGSLMDLAELESDEPTT